MSHATHRYMPDWIGDLFWLGHQTCFVIHTAVGLEVTVFYMIHSVIGHDVTVFYDSFGPRT